MQDEKQGREHHVADIRMQRPIAFYSTNTHQSVTIQLTETLPVGDSQVTFCSPNNVTLFVNIAHRERKSALQIYRLVISPRLKKDRVFEVKGKDLSRLYDYFEHIQTSIVAIYTAVEALANVAIPHDFTMTSSRKGAQEVWDKREIERWTSTSDKVKEIVPTVLGVESPKSREFWPDFCALESVRNDIIHQKTPLKEPDRLDTAFLGRLLQPEIFRTIVSGFSLIRYFCESEPGHSRFPFGFAADRIKPIVVDDLESVLEVIEEG